MSPDRPVQPKLTDLLVNYLNRRGDPLVSAEAEVVPYEAGPVHPIEPRLAWEETLVVARCFAPDLKTQEWKTPLSWAGLVAAHEPVAAVACALGNFPQMVRHFHAFLQGRQLSLLRPGSQVRTVANPAVIDWARHYVQTAVGAGQYLEVLIALGTLRLAKQFDEAEKLFRDYDTQIPAAWRAAWDNERAALAWHRGEAQQANDLWQRLEGTAVILFNRGMADLFLDRSTSAKTSLQAAIAGLPEDGGWHHLGQLYLTLAQAQ